MASSAHAVCDATTVDNRTWAALRTVWDSAVAAFSQSSSSLHSPVVSRTPLLCSCSFARCTIQAGHRMRVWVHSVNPKGCGARNLDVPVHDSARMSGIRCYPISHLVTNMHRVHDTAA